MVRRNAGIGDWPSAQHRAVDARKFPPARRCVGVEALLEEDIIDPEVEVRADGMIAISDAPGTGYHVREDLVKKFTVREETFRAGKA